MTDQLSLFSKPPPPAVFDAAAQTKLAERLPKKLRLGTSSWTFEGWRQLVYQRRYKNRTEFTQLSLEEYAKHPLFRTVGIDRSYYAPIEGHELQRYRSQIPEGFVCVCKVLSELTTFRFSDHPSTRSLAGQINPSFLDPVRFLDEVAAPIKTGLGSAAGPFLLQFPTLPSDMGNRFFEDRLTTFLIACAREHEIAVELRDARLLTPRYFAILHRHGASHCFNYWSRMPPLEDQLKLHRACPQHDDAASMVVRLLLPPGKVYREQREAFAPFDRIMVPQPDMRRAAVELIRYGELLGKEIFLLVNNKAEGSSPLTLRAIAELFLEQHRKP